MENKNLDEILNNKYEDIVKALEKNKEVIIRKTKTGYNLYEKNVKRI